MSKPSYRAPPGTTCPLCKSYEVLMYEGENGLLHCLVCSHQWRKATSQPQLNDDKLRKMFGGMQVGDVLGRPIYALTEGDLGILADWLYTMSVGNVIAEINDAVRIASGLHPDNFRLQINLGPYQYQAVGPTVETAIREMAGVIRARSPKG